MLSVRRDFFRLLAGALLPLLLGSVAVAGGTFINLGPQITSRPFQAAAFTQHRDGRDLLVTVVRGQPVAKLLVIDVANGELRHTFTLPGAAGGWTAVTASDRSVYIGTDPGGKLFRYLPGETVVRDLGVAIAGETHVWDLAAGADGEVFGGTYPHCRVFRYTPSGGFVEPVPGRIVDGETYARAVAFDAGSRTLYVGIGVKQPHLIELDLVSGRRETFPLPERLRREQSVYQLFLAGDHLFAMVYPAQRTLVFNRRLRRVVAELDTTGNYDFVSPPSPQDGRVYFLHQGKLKVFDPSAPTDRPSDVVAVPSSQAMTWLELPGEESATWLVIFTQTGQLIRHHPSSGRTVTTDVQAPEEPNLLHALATGPDGRIWSGGYLFGGAAAFDPTTDSTEQFKGISQAEQIAALYGKLYFGLYPRGRLQEFDPSKPWMEKGDNPRSLAALPNQSRPVALLAVPELGQLFVGTVPEYGLLGGMLAVWNAATRTLETFPDLVPRHSIVSLAFADGLVVGGTSIHGGLGVEHAAREARLFLWNPRERRLEFETVPVPERGIVSGLTPMPDRTVWGFAQGVFFVFDLQTRTVVHTAPPLDSDFTGRAMWQDASMVVHPDGDVFALQHDRLLRIAARTREISVLRHGIRSKHGRPIAMDREGRIYFADGADLWRYTP